MDWLKNLMSEMKAAIPSEEDKGLFGGEATDPPVADPMAKYINPVENNRSLLDFIKPSKAPKPSQAGRGVVNPALAGTVDQQVESVFPYLIKAESGGVHETASGKLLESNVGARGITQVMRKTGSDPGYGVKPLADESRGEYLRFGKDLLTAYTKEMGGDIAKGLAAYNWGIGSMKKAVAKHGDKWRDNLPKETSDYLNKILSNSNKRK